MNSILNFIKPNNKKLTRKEMDAFLYRMKLDPISCPGYTSTNCPEIIMTLMHTQAWKRKKYTFFEKLIRFLTNESEKEMKMMREIIKYELNLHNEITKKLLHEKIRKKAAR